jgi:hypothetical protein
MQSGNLLIHDVTIITLSLHLSLLFLSGSFKIPFHSSPFSSPSSDFNISTQLGPQDTIKPRRGQPVQLVPWVWPSAQRRLLNDCSVLTLCPQKDIHPAFAMVQSAAPAMGPLYEPSMTDDFDTMPHPACWTVDQPNFLGLSKSTGGDAQQNYDMEDFLSKYTYTPNPTNLNGSGSIFFQESPIPPRTSELLCPKNPSSNSDGPRRSSLTQSDKKKRRSTHNKRTATKSLGCDSTEKAKAQAAGKAHENKKRRGSINKASAINFSSPLFKDAIDIRKLQERNRVASNKCRIRKQEDERKLKSAEQHMEKLNRDLSTCATDLKSQVNDLKMMLLQHTNCNCVLIQEYITNEARRFIQGL